MDWQLVSVSGFWFQSPIVGSKTRNLWEKSGNKSGSFNPL